MPSSLEANCAPITLTPTRRARQLSERARPIIPRSQPLTHSTPCLPLTNSTPITPPPGAPALRARRRAERRARAGRCDLAGRCDGRCDLGRCGRAHGRSGHPLGAHRVLHGGDHTPAGPGGQLRSRRDGALHATIFALVFRLVLVVYATHTVCLVSEHTSHHKHVTYHTVCG